MLLAAGAVQAGAGAKAMALGGPAAPFAALRAWSDLRAPPLVTPMFGFGTGKRWRRRRRWPLCRAVCPAAWTRTPVWRLAPTPRWALSAPRSSPAERPGLGITPDRRASAVPALLVVDRITNPDPIGDLSCVDAGRPPRGVSVVVHGPY